jgi:putative oxidoreductase
MITANESPSASSRRGSGSKGLHITLWVIQILLALAFGMAGWAKVSVPIPELVQRWVWPGALPSALVRFIGVAELAAAVGLILPSATRIRPSLTVISAFGLVVVMLLAAGFHVSRGEVVRIPSNAVLGILAAVVAWGRSRKARIAPRR